MQLISHYFVSNFNDWKAAFDADVEARRNAGLTTLQIWQDADSEIHAFVLQSLTDRARTESWIERSVALASDDAKTVSRETHFFIETA
jgi:hypothetical protein